MSAPKFKIYQGILCLEMPSRHGHLWWDQGYNLAYCPLPLAQITHFKVGVLTETRQTVLAVAIPGTGMVAVNLPRSDLPGILQRINWPAGLSKPYTDTPNYHPWPTAHCGP